MITDKSIMGKRILFLSPAFFGYEHKIKSKMQQLGALVDYYDARSVSSSIDKALLKISPNIFKKKTRIYYEDILRANEDKNYDYVLIVKCDMISVEILEIMKKTYPNAKFCLYLWDSIKNIPNIKSKFHLFDNVFSFDRYDVENYNIIKFRPLFYIDDYKIDLNDSNNFAYDLSFCGTVHTDRYRIIKQVKKYCVDSNYRFFSFLFLQSKFIYWFYKLTKIEFMSTNKSDFDYDKLSSSDISKIVSDSRVILDIQHPKQTGLTIRTIEMIGMNKKLITTNKDIKNYDFYNSNNILIIPRNNIVIPKGFLSSRYVPLNSEIYNKYSIESWIFDILLK